MPTISQSELFHLQRRAGFGPSPDSLSWEEAMTREQAFDQLWEESKSAQPIALEGYELPTRQDMRAMSEEERQQSRRQGALALRQLNSAWIQRMVETKAQLREKMTLFWHDHFACRFNLAYLAQGQHEMLREYALGKFGDLLRAIARDPGMLQFLNNQQNRKEAPNENFARELLELFTLGRGNYTENDIREAARAFTGWGFNLQREFVFRTRWHDEGSKTFLGQTGNWDGDDIIRIVLEQKQTACFLVEKLYRYLVNPDLNKAQVANWADAFFDRGYDMEFLLREMLTSDHFYAPQNRGIQVKSPVEYLVSLLRLTGATLQDSQGYLLVQKVLGQTLFQPPNVAGWPLGKEWIDSSSLMARLQIPRAMFDSRALEIAARPSFAGNEDAIKLTGARAKLQAVVNWNAIEEQFGEIENLDDLQKYLMAQSLGTIPLEQLRGHVADHPPDRQFQILVTHLVCTPEFQLC